MNQTKLRPDLVIKNCGQLLTVSENSTDLVGLIRNGYIGITGAKITFIGTKEAYDQQIDGTDSKVIDGSNKVVLPGFVDCHTHLAFGKSRVEEYASGLIPGGLEKLRATGVKTGMEASVDMTRLEPEELLYQESCEKVDRMIRNGTTTIEIKSGYGLDRETELKQLRVISKLKQNTKADISATFLGAHGWPREMSKERYIDFLINEMIPLVAEEKLANACDIWVDEGYYTAREAEKVLRAGIDNGLEAKIHTDCYSYISGSDLAADMGMMSGDHLNYTPESAIKKMVESKVAGVLLPGTDFSVKHPRPFDPRPMLDAGMQIALATNLNPGNWVESQFFVITLACRRHQMTVEEAIRATTLGGAVALRKNHVLGSLEVDKIADIQIWDTGNYKDVAYRHGHNFVETVIKRGQVVVGYFD
ncbi:MAG: Imidazolonepropionase [Clostridiales bacterium 38_11]|nr:MAG: Imidazolonepropionase [Clostridiales bacterium 38_11]HBH13498.1 imidazolonepropionase [Clostridiales bacterium]